MTDKILFSIPDGYPITLEPFHYAIIGQTQFSGKTTLIKRLSEWVAAQGYTVLIFDTKETEADYAGFGNEVPVCLRETTDSFVLIGLLESMFKRRLTPYYATLSRLTEAAKGFGDIIRRAKELEAKTKSSWLRDACRVLYDLLERLQTETSKVEAVPQLKLYPGINRMVINEFSLEAQQLIIKNSFEDLLRIYKRKTIGVIDEAFKFLPQGYSSAATRAVMNVITQGAKTELYTWISTQFLAVTDKDPLKACAIKFLGTQDHITEVKHTLDLIPEARGKFSADDIMKLKLGHWVLVRKRPPFVGVVYALPVGVPESIGVEVARGIRTPESVRDQFLKVKVMEVNEEMWKQKFEEEQRKRIRVEEELLTLKMKYENLEVFPKQVEKLQAENEQLKKSFQALREWKDKLEDQLGELTTENARLHEEVEAFQEFKEAFKKFVMSITPRAGFEPASVPSEIAVNVTQPVLTVKTEKATVELTDKTTEGKTAIIYAEGKLPSDKWFTTTDVVNAFVSHGWPRDPRIGPTLDKMCQWGFFEKHYAGKRPEYKVRIKPEEAKAKGLLKEVEA